jgi:hypothetical protein
MLPIFDPTVVLFEPVALGMLKFVAVAVAGMAAVVAGLVALADRRAARPRATVSRLRHPHLPKAA